MLALPFYYLYPQTLLPSLLLSHSLSRLVKPRENKAFVRAFVRAYVRGFVKRGSFRLLGIFKVSLYTFARYFISGILWSVLRPCDKTPWCSVSRSCWRLLALEYPQAESTRIVRFVGRCASLPSRSAQRHLHFASITRFLTLLIRLPPVDPSIPIHTSSLLVVHSRFAHLIDYFIPGHTRGLYAVKGLLQSDDRNS